MSVWSVLGDKLKEMFKRMLGIRTVEQVLNISPTISLEMENAIDTWTKLYIGKAPWLHEPDDNDPSRIVSLGLPAMIASEKARTALIELASEITTPTKEVEEPNPEYTEPTRDAFGNLIPSAQPQFIKTKKPVGDTARADYLESQYKKLKKVLRTQIEYGIAKGGLVIKPYVINNNDSDSDHELDIEFDFIQADYFFPMSFDAAGRITEAAFLQTKTEKEYTYYRLEYHKWEKNKVTVTNTAYRTTNRQQLSANGISLGKEVPLTDVPEWKDLQAKVEIKDINKPLFAYFKMPEANTVDLNSPLGVSGFSKAVNLIKDADMQYSRLLWEYEGGELAIDIDRDALNFTTDAQGNDHTTPNNLQNRLYRKLDLGESDTYQPYTPSLRDANYTAGLNTILMRIEDVCGISRGTLSDATQEAKTATELKILKQRSYQTNADIQQAIEDAIRDVIYIMNVYCDLYSITKPGEYDVNFEWDDSIIVDVDSELSKRITLQQNGLTSKVENRMWYFGETEEQAKAALIKVQEENRQSMEDDMMFSRFGEGNE